MGEQLKKDIIESFALFEALPEQDTLKQTFVNLFGQRLFEIENNINEPKIDGSKTVRATYQVESQDALKKIALPYSFLVEKLTPLGLETNQIKNTLGQLKIKITVAGTPIDTTFEKVEGLVDAILPLKKQVRFKEEPEIIPEEPTKKEPKKTVRFALAGEESLKESPEEQQKRAQQFLDTFKKATVATKMSDLRQAMEKLKQQPRDETVFRTANKKMNETRMYLTQAADYMAVLSKYDPTVQNIKKELATQSKTLIQLVNERKLREGEKEIELISATEKKIQGLTTEINEITKMSETAQTHLSDQKAEYEVQLEEHKANLLALEDKYTLEHAKEMAIRDYSPLVGILFNLELSENDIKEILNKLQLRFTKDKILITQSFKNHEDLIADIIQEAKNSMKTKYN